MKRKIIPKKAYNTSGYYVTNHAVKRMNERQVSKGELGYNLRHKPRFKTLQMTMEISHLMAGSVGIGYLPQ